MNLDTLKLFCDVVRLRSFSRAASGNGVTQSAASQAMQQLEAELDVPLLDRSRRPLVATEAGRVFFEACRDLLECLHPHKVVEAVQNDEADVGVLSYPAATRTLDVLPLRSEPMVLVTHPGHRLAKRRHVALGDLMGEKFVAFDRDLAVRKAIDRALKQHGVKVEVVMEFDNVETIKQAIGIAAGVSILPRPTVVMESGMRTLATVPLALSGLARPIGLIYRRGKRLTPAVARFIETLRKADEATTDDAR